MTDIAETVRKESGQKEVSGIPPEARDAEAKARFKKRRSVRICACDVSDDFDKTDDFGQSERLRA